jgi:curved DNA-binding protein CbpA
MSKIEIDFNNIKYNLYEILNVNKHDDDIKIKKSFMKVIKNFHPDKNSELEEDIYYHIILANQILLNKESRKKYDEFINDTSDTFCELKNKFNKHDKNKQNKQDIGLFNQQISELNKKHGYDESNNNKNIMSQYSNLKKNRDNQINIPQEKISNNDDFNEKFQNRIKEGVFDKQNFKEGVFDKQNFKEGVFEEEDQNRQIIPSKNENLGLGTWQPNDGLATLNDYSKLYAEDTVSTGSYTSLDMAFKIQKVDQNIKEKTLAERMEEYKNQTNTFNSRKPSDFSNKSFTDWNPK